jgi:hypothetical protein
MKQFKRTFSIGMFLHLALSPMAHGYEVKVSTAGPAGQTEDERAIAEYRKRRDHLAQQLAQAREAEKAQDHAQNLEDVKKRREAKIKDELEREKTLGRFQRIGLTAGIRGEIDTSKKNGAKSVAGTAAFELDRFRIDRNRETDVGTSSLMTDVKASATAVVGAQFDGRGVGGVDLKGRALFGLTSANLSRACGAYFLGGGSADLEGVVNPVGKNRAYIPALEIDGGLNCNGNHRAFTIGPVLRASGIPVFVLPMIGGGVRARYIADRISLEAMGEMHSAAIANDVDLEGARTYPNGSSSTALEGRVNADIKVGERGFVGVSGRYQKVLSATDYSGKYETGAAPGRAPTAVQANLRGGFDF